MDCWVGVRLKA